MRINTNTNALFGQRMLDRMGGALSRNLERLSSGLRINRAADDAAGLAVSERFRSQSEGIRQARTNTQDALSLLGVAEGGYANVTDMLQRLRTLAVQAANDTLTDNDRALVQKEVTQLLAEIDRQASTVSFNGKRLLTGAVAEPGFGGGRHSKSDSELLSRQRYGGSDNRSPRRRSSSS
jgi:flagellin